MNILNLSQFIRVFALGKVPLLGLLGPKVITYSNQASVVRLPLNFLSKNHLGSMYFGALAMGAELSVALPIVDKLRSSKAKASFIFKDFSCEFKRRAETNVDFCCLEIEKINELFAKAINSGERVEGTYAGFAVPSACPALTANESDYLMTYRLTISVKRSSRSS